MDKIDKQILLLLEQDARISFAQLAQEVGLSKTPCWKRVKDLQNNGFITAFKAQINPQKLGLEIFAIVHVIVDFSLSTEFERAVCEHNNVMSCHAITGDFDYVLKIAAHDMIELDNLLRQELSRIKGVQRFSTAIATRTIKQGTSVAKILT